MEQKEDIAQQRQKLEALVKQAKEDPKFRETIKADPVGVLTQAGISMRMIGDVVGEEVYLNRDPNDPTLSPQQRAAVKAHRECDGGCCLTCIFTGRCGFTYP
jgi:hypothetical protein